MLVDDNAEQAPAPPAAKKTKKGDSFLDDIYSVSSASVNGNEVFDYLASTDSSDDILSHWKDKAMQWPGLFHIARCYLGIPPTSTSSERSFSLADGTLEERGSQLDPDTVDDLMFIHGLH